MLPTDSLPAVGLLLSGGLDSGILLGHLLRQGSRVQPFYVQAGLVWERDELKAVRSFLTTMDDERLDPLVTLEMPLDDLYGNHWSITGRGVPNAETADDAVYLPGRNIVLLAKPIIWCRQHGIGTLALAVLKSNPFGDASREFFDHFEAALRHALGDRLQIIRPFGEMTKSEVMGLGRDLPLDLTFSCIKPLHGMHCGCCNKCAERQAAFRSIALEDPTKYSSAAGSASGHKFSAAPTRWSMRRQKL
jgi:7-cyano-7-deazaguanine synthase